jgi:hypothetical protein
MNNQEIIKDGGDKMELRKWYEKKCAGRVAQEEDIYYKPYTMTNEDAIKIISKTDDMIRCASQAYRAIQRDIESKKEKVLENGVNDESLVELKERETFFDDMLWEAGQSDPKLNDKIYVYERATDVLFYGYDVKAGIDWRI